MNCRRYPRTTAEAFKGPDYASAIERPTPRTSRAWWIAFAIAAIAALLARS